MEYMNSAERVAVSPGERDARQAPEEPFEPVVHPTS
jgi:hypothetical protein